METPSTMTVATGAETVKRFALWVGPIVTVLFAVRVCGDGAFIDSSAQHVAVWTALALWSPLAVSVASVLCGADRDRTLSSMRGPVGSLLRGVLLPFALLAHRELPVRKNAYAAFGGFAAAVGFAAGFGLI